MKVALEVWSSSFAQVEATCVLAESLELDAFYYGESPHDLNLDCWTTLAGLSRSTERIRLGPVITNILPTYRSTLLLAKQAATVASMSGGRIDLRTGVGASAAFGRGWWQPFGVDYPNYEQRLSDLETAIEALPRLWADGPRIPVTIAAKSERAMRLAGAHADVWETSFCTPTEFAEQRARFEELTSESGVVRSLEIDGFVARTARGVGRLLDRVRSERGAAEDLDPVFERALIGTPADAAAQLGELESAGVQQVVVALHDPHDPDAIEAIAEAAALRRTARQRTGA